MRRFQFQRNAALRLKMRDDGKEVFGLRVAPLAEHPHQTFRRGVDSLPKMLKTDSAVDVFTQNGFPGDDIARQQAFDALTKKGVPKPFIFLDALPEGVFKTGG